MFSKLVITHGGCEGVKFGCTNQQSDNRACNVERSARDNGHLRFSPNASDYYFASERSMEIAEAEHKIHLGSHCQKSDDVGRTFNGSTEIQNKRDARRPMESPSTSAGGDQHDRC